MLKWAFVFMIVSLIAGVLGFTTVAGAAFDIAKVLFYVFLFLCVLAFAAGYWIIKKVRH